METPQQIDARIRLENPTIPIAGLGEQDGVVIVSPEEFPEWYEEEIATRIALASDVAKTRVRDTADLARRANIITLYRALKADRAKLLDPATTVNLALLAPIVLRLVRAVMLNMRTLALVPDEEGD